MGCQPAFVAALRHGGDPNSPCCVDYQGVTRIAFPRASNFADGLWNLEFGGGQETTAMVGVGVMDLA